MDLACRLPPCQSVCTIVVDFYYQGVAVDWGGSSHVHPNPNPINKESRKT
jgi:hypothetical protein